MSQDRIDASLGLAFSLTLFEQYRQSGLLQAELRHVPGYRGRCTGYLRLIQGKVVSCYLEDQQGHQHPMSLEILCRLDNEKGPFEWSLIPLQAPPLPLVEPVRNPSPVPRRIAELNLDHLTGWTTRHKKMLEIVFDTIDGQRTIVDIKNDTPLPPEVVEEALHILLTMRVITLEG